MPQINIKQSGDQSVKLDEALAESKMEKSTFVRSAIREKCKLLGIDYPADVGRGKHDRSQIDWQKLADDQQDPDTQ